MQPRWRLVIYASIAAVVAIAAVAVLLTRSGSESGSGRIDSFYMEASFSPQLPGDEPTPQSARGWYLAPDRWRWEVTLVDGAGRTYEMVQVSDGSSVIDYDAYSGTCYRRSVDEYWNRRNRGEKSLPNLPVGGLLGPVGNGDIDLFLSGLTHGYRVQGQDELLGIPVDVVVAGGNDAALWLWLDRAHGLSLRYEARVGYDYTGGSEDAITRLELNKEVDTSRFKYTPPPSAIEVAAPRMGP